MSVATPDKLYNNDNVKILVDKLIFVRTVHNYLSLTLVNYGLQHIT